MSSMFPVLVSLLIASFIGSYHCGMMCGPIACSFRLGKSLWLYHLGRLFSYSALGAFGGAVGSMLWKSQWVWVPKVTGFFMGIGLIAMGLQYIFHHQKGVGFNLMKHPALQKVFRSYKQNAVVVGLLSVFLPCSWLYTFLLAAAQTKSGFAGAIVMFTFWLGGLPALSILPQYMKKALTTSSSRMQSLAGVLILVGGIYSIFVHLFLP